MSLSPFSGIFLPSREALTYRSLWASSSPFPFSILKSFAILFLLIYCTQCTKEPVWAIVVNFFFMAERRDVGTSVPRSKSSTLARNLSTALTITGILANKSWPNAVGLTAFARRRCGLGCSCTCRRPMEDSECLDLGFNILYRISI